MKGKIKAGFRFDSSSSSTTSKDGTIKTQKKMTLSGSITFSAMFGGLILWVFSVF